VLVVTRPGKPDGLIPMIRDVVQELDPASGRVVIHPIAGLLD
jgi:16S rRNA processing protein RimM